MTIFRKILVALFVVGFPVNLYGLLGYFEAAELSERLRGEAREQREARAVPPHCRPTGPPMPCGRPQEQDVEAALDRLAAARDPSRWKPADALGIRQFGFKLGLTNSLMPEEILLLSPEPAARKANPGPGIRAR